MKVSGPPPTKKMITPLSTLPANQMLNKIRQQSIMIQMLKVKINAFRLNECSVIKL